MLSKKSSLSAAAAAVLLLSLTACGAGNPSALQGDGSAAPSTAGFKRSLSGATAAVRLGTAGSFAILSKSGITDVYASAITGNVGTSPITGAALLLTCGEVTGNIYVVDAAGPLPCALNDATSLTAAVGDMETAYLDAEGRVSPNFTELGAGEIGGLTLVPGLYKWGTGLLISTDVTLSGGPNDVWIFQVAGTMNQASATRVTLAGGAQARNIFWQVAGAVTVGTTAHLEGVVLAKTLIAVNTGASVNGRLLAQTAVTLQMNAVTQPAE
jgi:Ice-binding-like